jgi:hypothetical protein
MEKFYLDENMISELHNKLSSVKNHDKFIQYYEMAALVELACVDDDIVADIQRLASKGEKTLINKIKAVASEMEFETDWNEEEIEIIIKKIKKLADISEAYEVGTGILSLVAQILTKEYGIQYKGQELIDKNIALMRFLLNNDIKSKINKLRSNEKFYKIPPELLYTIRDIAIDESISHMLETLHHKELHEAIFSMKGAVFQNKRWKELNILYEKALEYAEDQWANNGSRLTRNDMADYLTTNDRLVKSYQFDQLNYEKLRKLLAPIAKKYGKLLKRGRPSKNK